MCANVGGESLAGGEDMFGRLIGRERKREVGGVGEFENRLIVSDSIWYSMWDSRLGLEIFRLGGRKMEGSSQKVKIKVKGRLQIIQRDVR